ncbi:MAG TPA: hypothetical protein VFS40_14465 [Gemmatimonadales bacterium]|nr:hypothetical protein [Gemmatimonadales bacterium]
MAAAQSLDHRDEERPRERAETPGAEDREELSGIGAERLNFVRRLARFGLGEHPHPLLARLLFPEPRK